HDAAPGTRGGHHGGRGRGGGGLGRHPCGERARRRQARGDHRAGHRAQLPIDVLRRGVESEERRLEARSAILVPTMRARSLAPLASLAALLSLCACAEPKVSLATGAREYVPSDYQEVLKRWTRDQSLIQLSELDDKLTV